MDRKAPAGLLQEQAERFKAGYYDFSDQGTCSRCGECCGNFLPLSGREIQTIHRYVKRHGIKEVRRVLPTAGEYLNPDCPFLEEHRCLIYDIRPRICREYDCSKAWHKEPSQALQQGDYRIVNMRKEFFGERT